LLFGLAMCIVLLGLAVWRPPGAVVWFVVVVVGASVVLGRWWSGQLPIRQAGGEVVVLGDKLTQTDGWTYQTSGRDVFATLRWTDVSRPIFATRAGMDDLWWSLNCDTGGRPKEFAVQLPAGRRIAYLSREVGTVAPATPATKDAGGSPLEMLVNEGVYSGRVLGRLPGAPPNVPAFGEVEMEQWGTIVIEGER
jgi:hypothetical protein